MLLITFNLLQSLSIKINKFITNNKTISNYVTKKYSTLFRFFPIHKLYKIFFNFNIFYIGTRTSYNINIYNKKLFIKYIFMKPIAK